MANKLDLFRPEPLLVNTEPEATNSLTSRATFYQRKLYELVAFNSSLIGDTKPIDFWYEKTFYGRINPDSKAVHVSEAFLKQIPGTPDLFLLNFVTDAFEDLREFFGFMISRDAIETQSVYTTLNPTAAWTRLNTFYHDYITVIYDKFKVFVSDHKKDRDIKDFKTFVSIFVEFIDSITPLLSLTRSKIVVSRFADPKASGLIVEVGNDLHGTDRPKVETYLNDPNFPVFKETAQRFGFVVDRHAPWRLVADLGSPAMKPYLDDYELNLETLFERYYYTSFEIDLQALKAYIIQFYNSYVTGKRVLVEPIFSFDESGRVVIENREIVREPKTTFEIDQETSDEFWLRMYAFIRAREENKEWNQAEFEKVVRNAFFFLEGVDMEHAIEYIHRRSRLASGSPRKQRDYHFINFQRLN